jgi:hypothetical protein
MGQGETQALLLGPLGAQSGPTELWVQGQAIAYLLTCVLLAPSSWHRVGPCTGVQNDERDSDASGGGRLEAWEALGADALLSLALFL